MSDTASIDRLTYHITHQRLVLQLSVGAALFARLPPPLTYWLLGRNIWISPEPMGIGPMVQTWLALRHEDRGPLSTMRHDIRNAWSSRADAERLAEAVNLIGDCERLLVMPSEPAQQLTESLRGDDSASSAFKEQLSTAAEVLTLRGRAVEQIARLDRVLATAGEDNPDLRPGTDAQRHTLSLLDRFIRGQRWE